MRYHVNSFGCFSLKIGLGSAWLCCTAMPTTGIEIALLSGFVGFVVGGWSGCAWGRVAISPFKLKVGKYTFAYNTNPADQV